MEKSLPKKIEILVTADIETGHVEVRGPLVFKLLVIKALATATQIVVDHAPPVITMPAGFVNAKPANGKPN